MDTSKVPYDTGGSGVSQHTVDSTTNLAKRLKCNGVFKNFMVSCYMLNVTTIKIPENQNTYIINIWKSPVKLIFIVKHN